MAVLYPASAGLLLGIALGFGITGLVFVLFAWWHWLAARAEARAQEEIATKLAKTFGFSARAGEDGLELFGEVEGVEVELLLQPDMLTVSAALSPFDMFIDRPERAPGSITIVDRRDVDSAPRSMTSADEDFNRAFFVFANPTALVSRLRTEVRSAMLQYRDRGLSVEDYRVTLRSEEIEGVSAHERAIRKVLALVKAIKIADRPI